jgi:hypothetical protein
LRGPYHRSKPATALVRGLAIRSTGRRHVHRPVPDHQATHQLIEESRLGGKATAIGVAPLEKTELGKLLGHRTLLK